MCADVPSDPALASATELIGLYRAGALSPVEATRAVLARIERHRAAVNAWVHLDPDGAMAAARASEARWQAGAPMGLLDGVPVGIKDNILVAGMPARFGSRLTPAGPRDADAPAAARLREAGAVILGKTAMPEYGWKATSDSPLTGITRNPWDTRKTTGGSSAGAAAATVLGMGAIHIGTDGGGSIRIPAAFTGCFGIKPTRARVPAWPAAPIGTLAHVGPLTRTVADAALALTVIAAPDARDVYAWPQPAPDFRDRLDAGVRGLRIAFSPRLGYAPRLDAEVETAVAAAAATFERLGAVIEAADPDIGGDPLALWSTFWWPAMRYTLDALDARWRDQADPALTAAVDTSRPISVSEHLSAQLQRASLHNALARFHERYDLIVTPTLPLPAFEAGQLVPASGQWGSAWPGWAPFSYPFNLTTQPAASVPCGLTAAGLPVGLQVVGPVGADARVLRACRALEQAMPFPILESPRTGTA